MTCLTRSLEKQLMMYLKTHTDKINSTRPEAIRQELVDKGVCPSDVTADQFRALCEKMGNTHHFFAK